AVTPSGPAASRAESQPDTNQPPSAPELARLAPRTALGPPSRKASLADDRVALGRELQRELARVGCYEGDLNGIWTPATRKAMKAVTDRINASLPIEEPDDVLLTLLLGHRARVCGTARPVGA